MAWPIFLFAYFLIGLALLSLGLTLQLYRRKPLAISIAGGALLFSSAIWAMGNGFELLSGTLGPKLFWADVQVIGMVMAPLAWFAYVALYTGRQAWINRTTISLLGLVPALYILLTFTNSTHHLIWASVQLVERNGYTMLTHSYGPGVWAFAVYAYALLALASLLLVQATVRSKNLQRAQSITLLVAAFVPWIANFSELLRPNLLSLFQLTPLAFSLTGLIVFWNLTQLYRGDLLSSSRGLVLDTMIDCVLVLNDQNHIIDVNSAAVQFLSQPKSTVLGRTLLDVWPDYPKDLLTVSRSERISVDRALTSPGAKTAPQYYNVRISPLINPQNSTISRVLVLHDISERLLSEQGERTQREIAETLLEVAGELNTDLSLDRVLPLILEQLARVVSYDSASIMLMEGNLLRSAVRRSTHITRGPFLAIPLDQFPHVQEVILQKRPVIITDTTSDYRWLDLPSTQQIRCWLGVPLMVEDRVIGLLNLSKTVRAFYTERDTDLVSAFAAQATIAIENARLYAEAQRQLTQQTALREAGAVISSSLDLESVLHHIADRMQGALNTSSINLYSFNPGEKRAQLVARFADPDLLPGDRPAPPMPKEGAQRALRLGLTHDMTKDLVRIDQLLESGKAGVFYAEDPNLNPSESEYMQAFGVKTMLIVPLRVGGQTTAYAELWDTAQHREFGQDEIGLAQGIAQQAAIAMLNAQLYAQSQQEIADRKLAETALQAERTSLARRVEERTSELSLANAELARSSRLKDEFLASMSHELRTPLNAILGMSEAIQEGVYGDVDPDQHKPLRAIVESGHHLLDLINEILDLSKIEAGKMELMIAPVSVAATAQASMQFVRQAATHKELTTTVEIESGVNVLMADERRLKQMLINLLSNAVKFTPEGGAVGLRVTGNREEDSVTFTVWDTGIGIDEQDMGRLFRPFVQLDSSLTRRYTGTGLGLVLVYRMAEMHGGSVRLHSQVGQGSEFSFTLPWHRAQLDSARQNGKDLEVTASQETDQATEKPVNGATLLLAEDNETNIDTFVAYLHAHGFNVVVARDGQQAIEMARTHTPNLILMDVQMPVVDGLEAIRVLRTLPATQKTPIIALTALAMTGDRERCLQAGANDYLSKPVGLRDLVAAIHRQLG